MNVDDTAWELATAALRSRDAAKRDKSQMQTERDALLVELDRLKVSYNGALLRLDQAERQVEALKMTLGMVMKNVGNYTHDSHI